MTKNNGLLDAPQGSVLEAPLGNDFWAQEMADIVLDSANNNYTKLLELELADGTFKEFLKTQLAHEFLMLRQTTRHNTIDDCIERLGGRYGAAATKDLRSLKGTL